MAGEIKKGGRGEKTWPWVVRDRDERRRTNQNKEGKDENAHAKSLVDLDLTVLVTADTKIGLELKYWVLK